MADDDYGAAQPIMDVVKGAYKKANHIYSALTGGSSTEDSAAPIGQQKQVDPTYQSDMLKNANDSFKIPTQTKAQKRPVVAAKMQIKTTVKPGPQKQAGGK